ncbi:CAAX amino terminal protease self- immunity [compost metagenome]
MFMALVSSLVLAPIGEEILFRGILLNMFGSSRTWVLGIGVVLVALFFAWIHTQYQSTSTAVQLFALSVVFSWARLRSGGLLLPVLLHALASVLGIVVAWIQVAVL